MNSVTSLHQQQTPKKSRTNISPPNPSRFALSIHRFSNPQSSTLHPSTHLPSPTLENSYPSLLFPLPSTRSNSPSPFPSTTLSTYTQIQPPTDSLQPNIPNHEPSPPAQTHPATSPPIEAYPPNTPTPSFPHPGPSPSSHQ